jgi:nucleotide-binding universal stress UspA family protein
MKSWRSLASVAVRTKRDNVAAERPLPGSREIHMQIKRILVAVDYSECSATALGYAARLAETLGASLDVVHAWERPPYVSDAMLVQHGDGQHGSLVELIRDRAQAEMSEFIARAALPGGVPVEQRLLAGNPAAKILDELKLGKHELLVVGTHGRTGLEHLLLGSVAETLVRLSPIPVLTVPRA